LLPLGLLRQMAALRPLGPPSLSFNMTNAKHPPGPAMTLGKCASKACAIFPNNFKLIALPKVFGTCGPAGDEYHSEPKLPALDTHNQEQWRRGWRRHPRSISIGPALQDASCARRRRVIRMIGNGNCVSRAAIGHWRRRKQNVALCSRAPRRRLRPNSQALPIRRPLIEYGFDRLSASPQSTQT